ncbi:MAG: cytochrome oxidase biogenesis protein Surf1, facilitates heme A insertion [Alphaproteobacteria bacterium MedPE-SWcel]|nr:MAG: cytochrome oxidase biogenesis protein Surf1, facilitates heme A insertion [Alphaproteobacteria bacterium MedPE-SWcel]
MGRVIFLCLIGGLGAAMLLSLGIWQLQRLAWKRDILATIEHRIAADPVALPSTPDPEADKYRPVRVTGQYDPAEIHVLTSVKDLGPGYRIIAAFVTETGRRIMVDRGFVKSRDRETRRPLGQAELIGNLHWPDEVDGYTPAPEIDANIWYARDVPHMAEVLATEPLLVVLRGASDDASAPRVLPVSTRTIANDHLQYAITWFSLALIWVTMTATFLLRTRAKT